MGSVSSVPGCRLSASLQSHELDPARPRWIPGLRPFRNPVHLREVHSIRNLPAAGIRATPSESEAPISAHLPQQQPYQPPGAVIDFKDNLARSRYPDLKANATDKWTGMHIHRQVSRSARQPGSLSQPDSRGMTDHEHIEVEQRVAVSRHCNTSPGSAAIA